ncbi:MAG: trypsin-like peptidase domain-containing protein [Saprospiraceae bacterium]
MNDYIEAYQKAIVQIATPKSSGTGFALASRRLLVTNYHVVEGARRVIVENKAFGKQLVEVCYCDSGYDLAFLRPDQMPDDLPDLPLVGEPHPVAGERVTAMGHPRGLRFSVKNGIISNAYEEINGIPYLHIDAALNPGNSGGPLIDAQGRVIGINTFVMRDGDNIGFSLPARFVLEALDAFERIKSPHAVRCKGCSNIVTDETVAKGACNYCGAKIQLPHQIPPFQPHGVALILENLFVRLGFDVELSRSGPDMWELRQGSARIQVSYHEKTGLISADAILCRLPQEKIGDMYAFLLRENFSTEALTFSLREQDIILSLLIFDRYLDEEIGLRLLKNLLEKADEYDNLLVEKFGARWVE